MKTVILDTSFILTALRHRIDIATAVKEVLETSCTFAIISKTIKELQGKKEEKLALEYLAKQRITIITSPQDGNVDSLILSRATPHTIVATQDKKLKEKLKKRRIPVITIRQKRYVVAA